MCKVCLLRTILSWKLGFSGVFLGSFYPVAGESFKVRLAPWRDTSVEDAKWNGSVVPRVSALLEVDSMHSVCNPGAMSV